MASVVGPTLVAAKCLWEFEVGARIISQALVNDDGEIFFGSGDKKVYGIHADGSLKWDFTTGGDVNISYMCFHYFMQLLAYFNSRR
jgi:outer membrane protein assembly factor BamB